jgi:hypothetical protein
MTPVERVENSAHAHACSLLRVNGGSEPFFLRISVFKERLPLCVFERIPLGHFERSERARIRPKYKAPIGLGVRGGQPHLWLIYALRNGERLSVRTVTAQRDWRHAFAETADSSGAPSVRQNPKISRVGNVHPFAKSAKRWGTRHEAAEDIDALASEGESVQPIQEASGNFERIVQASRDIGIDRTTGLATSVFHNNHGCGRSACDNVSGGAIVGLTIVLESEDGRAIAAVEDIKNRLHDLLPNHDDDRFQVIRFIDWYGDTVVNRVQAATFLQEWETLRKKANSKEDQDLVFAIRELALRLQAEPHLYLKFYGD